MKGIGIAHIYLAISLEDMEQLFIQVLCEGDVADHVSGYLESPWAWGSFSIVNKLVNTRSAYDARTKQFQEMVKDWHVEALEQQLNVKVPDANAILWYLKGKTVDEEVILGAVERLLSVRYIKDWNVERYIWANQTQYGLRMERMLKRILRERGAVRCLLRVIDSDRVDLLAHACSALVRVEAQDERRYACIDVIIGKLNSVHSETSVEAQRTAFRLHALYQFCPGDSIILQKLDIMESVRNCLTRYAAYYCVQSAGAKLAIGLYKSFWRCNVWRWEIMEKLVQINFIGTLANNQVYDCERGTFHIDIWTSITWFLEEKKGSGCAEVINAAAKTLQRCKRDADSVPIPVLVKVIARVAEDFYGVEYITENVLQDVNYFLRDYHWDFQTEMEWWKILYRLSWKSGWGFWLREEKLCSCVSNKVSIRVSQVRRAVRANDNNGRVKEIIFGLELLASLLFHDRSEVIRCIETVIHAMEALKDFRTIVCAACYLLSNVVVKDLQDYPLLVVTAFNQIISAMRLYWNSYEIQEKGCEALINLLSCRSRNIDVVNTSLQFVINMAWDNHWDRANVRRLTSSIQQLIDSHQSFLHDGRFQLTATTRA